MTDQELKEQVNVWFSDIDLLVKYGDELKKLPTKGALTEELLTGTILKRLSGKSFSEELKNALLTSFLGFAQDDLKN